MLIQRIGEPAFDERRSDSRVVVRFRVNRQPDQAWISSFKAHAASSALGATNAVFNGNDAAVELARPKSMAETSTALDCFIECANLGLKSWGTFAGTPKTNPAPPRSFRGKVRDRA
ncbi:MAG: hypothetical protein DME04_22680 [Candidatus Rokuibacteriota bacterium]|nr:MAG: hypothetical protein DME04_22680 [Candidatus Rokubacteria bacterium]